MRRGIIGSWRRRGGTRHTILSLFAKLNREREAQDTSMHGST